jgi:small subunit ribosomal protein S17
MNRGHRKVREGTVVSDKMDKTVVVRIDRYVRHPLYQKGVRKSEKFKAHNEDNKAKLGDKVRLAETRPLSRDKRWRVTEIIGKTQVKKREEASI